MSDGVNIKEIRALNKEMAQLETRLDRLGKKGLNIKGMKSVEDDAEGASKRSKEQERNQKDITRELKKQETLQDRIADIVKGRTKEEKRAEENRKRSMRLQIAMERQQVS